MSKPKTEYYISPKEFKEELTTYYSNQLNESKIAEYLIKIAKGLSFTSNFINYSYKEEMVGDALVKMWNAVLRQKFNLESESNPFSYFTTIAFNAFINRIKKEKKHHDAIVAYKEKMYTQNMCNEEHGDLIYVKPLDDEENDYSFDE